GGHQIRRDYRHAFRRERLTDAPPPPGGGRAIACGGGSGWRRPAARDLRTIRFSGGAIVGGGGRPQFGNRATAVALRRRKARDPTGRRSPAILRYESPSPSGSIKVPCPPEHQWAQLSLDRESLGFRKAHACHGEGPQARFRRR